MNHIVVTNRPWHREMPQTLNALTGDSFFLISAPDELTVEALAEIDPQYVFFPHWSYILPKEIYHRFECVMFHMTNLPFGRGGSPLQNLVARGIYETMITAFRCDDGIDTGPVYAKRPFSLHGNAEEIYLRASDTMTEMIAWIVANRPAPLAQTGEPVCFPRRSPADGNLAQLKDLRQIYDFIRMLDAAGYPSAFAEMGEFRLDFRRAALRQDGIHADVIIKRK